jgi:hypothetical protein
MSNFSNRYLTIVAGIASEEQLETALSTKYDATNPLGFITTSGAPVQSVNGKTGVVVLVPADLGLIGSHGGLLVPKLSNAYRSTVILDAGEVVFDLDLRCYFGGDGVTLGGIEIACGAPVLATLLTTESGDVITTENGFSLEI